MARGFARFKALNANMRPFALPAIILEFAGIFEVKHATNKI